MSIASPERIKDVNARYHDVAAATFDSKWLVDFDEDGRRTVRAKVAGALGQWPERPFGDALEIGAGTGYFCLNLARLGVAERITATDISQGMLDQLRANASTLGVTVRTERSDGEQLPFEDRSFDLVFGHAILHHLPDVERAFSELFRVLRPGGTIVFCGEPSRYGSIAAHAAMRLAFAVSPLWRGLLRVPPGGDSAAGDSPTGEVDALEPEIDVHRFSPHRLRSCAAGAGFKSIRLQGQGFAASLWGWALRGLYSTADAARVPARWRNGAIGLLRLTQRVDAAFFERLVPAALLYDLALSARKPGIPEL